MTSTTTPLDNERYINLETFRQDGSGVKTPVWAAALDGKLVVTTDGTSFKAKRLRKNPRLRAAACDSRGKLHGPWYTGTARFLDDPAAIARADATLKRKYGLQYTLIGLVMRLRGRTRDRVFLELTIEGPA
jgi:PPOX class probable F420-dependent enzyme